ncbi:trypsin-like serine protease [Thiorhodococcus mannitoliphagus]|uniref:Trypsin-like serine protease n=1 Tax=Thiorhodococcus mannitoliphagus TaxID=329406 RepID=A0A6P1E2F9_9GAMM|nr:trypsin-like serine protease [Thiorhodococcus mannitoliphagus]NEX22692.1 trypsin-like serine protease [Thiorhodococcus mannitoliphagus]
MGKIRLSGKLIPLVLLATSGAVSALDVMPQMQAAVPAAPAQATSRQLNHMVGQLPASAAAAVELTEEDQAKIAEDNRTAASGTPLKIGLVKEVGIDVDLQPLDVPAMTEQTYSFAGGTVRRSGGRLALAINLHTTQALGTRLRFDNVRLAGGNLYVTNEAGTVFGPYSGPMESFWSATIPGEELTVYVDVAEEVSDNVNFTIGAALLFDRGALHLCADNAPCVEDASCHTAAEWPAIDNARKAVAHINFVQGSASYLCSGGLLTDTDPDTSIPYFLTANHCIDDPEVARTVEAWFDYKTPFCGAPCHPIQPGTASTLGATLLNNSAVDDHSLLALDEPPPEGSWYLGWTDTSMTEPSGSADGTMLFRLSHPRGSPQAFSAQRIERSADCGIDSLPYGRFIFSRDVMGATEGGSSGSPVMLSDGRVVGQLFGACGYFPEDVCDRTNSVVDGAFASYFNDIAKWLSPNPEQLPVTVQKFGTGEGRIVSSLNAESDSASPTAEAAISAQPRLLGSTPVEQSEWPWQAALKIDTWRINGQWSCGGSVIAPNWILTAAHCIVDNIDDRHMTIAPANILVRTGSTQFDFGGQMVKVKRIVKHPEFDPLTFNHDIALLELKEPVYVEPVRPVTWNREAALACPGTAGAVTGWTPTELCGLTETLLSKVDVSITNPDTCRRAYPDADITNYMLCSTLAAEDDELCQADDGSPLVVGNGRGGFVQAGVVSWGNGCDSPDSPTVYTRVATHVEWMESVTGDDLSSELGNGVIDCGSNCISQFPKDSVITLTAEATPGSAFAGWEGACTGEEGTCELTITQALNVKAIFNSTQISAKSCSFRAQ